MNAEELAILFLEQVRAYREGVPPEREEPAAIFVWEALICDDPERAWPVFDEALRRISDDEMFEAVWYRLRLLLYRHYDAFHERAEDLLRRFRRFAFVAGPKALEASEYREEPFDRDALAAAYRIQYATFDTSREVERLAHTDPQRALMIALEIIHRGVARGWEAFDLMSPLQTLLARNGKRVIDQVEELARTSVAVRRVLWRLKRQMRSLTSFDEESPLQHASPGIDPKIRERVELAAGSTTDYTEREVAIPPPQEQLEIDERIIDAWFTHAENFWAFSAMRDLCDEDPKLAWSVTLDLIARADDEREIAAIAAGPLEDLIRKHADAIWTELWEKAHTDERVANALRGVWVFERDGEVYNRFRELMTTLDARPN